MDRLSPIGNCCPLSPTQRGNNIAHLSPQKTGNGGQRANLPTSTPLSPASSETALLLNGSSRLSKTLAGSTHNSEDRGLSGQAAGQHSPLGRDLQQRKLTTAGTGGQSDGTMNVHQSSNSEQPSQPGTLCLEIRVYHEQNCGTCTVITQEMLTIKHVTQKKSPKKVRNS